MMLFRLLSWPYVRKHVLRTVLTTTGVAVGVVMFVGMHTANESVVTAFSETIDRIAGKTDLQITAGDAGFGEDVLERVQTASTVRVAVPVIEAVVDPKINGQGNLLVLGVDMTGDRSLRDYDFRIDDGEVIDDPLIFLAQPDSLIVSQQFADRNSIAVGSRLLLETAAGEKTFTVRGIMKPSGLATAFGGNLAIMDVYAAQKMFGRGRTFDRIDVGVASGAMLANCERDLATILGPGFDVQPPSTRGRQVEAMLAGYAMMVGFASMFALGVGMFIIYSSFAIAVMQRRSEIGILRALGATARQVRWLFIGESAIMGLVGSIIGLAAGVLIARAIASAMSVLISDLYGVAHQAAELSTDPTVLVAALVIGVVTSVIAAIVPAWHAAHIDPVYAVMKGRQAVLAGGESRRRIAVACAMALLSIACLSAPESRAIFYAGYAFTIGSALLLGPILSMWLTRAVRPVFRWLQPVEGTLAADSLIQTPRRTSPTVAALMLSLALVVAFSGMARASHRSVIAWMDTVLNADLFVLSTYRLGFQTTRFPASMADEIAAVPGVERVQLFRNGRITFQRLPVMVVAVEMNSVAETARLEPVAGNTVDMYRKAAAGEGVIVSDNLAQARRLVLGDTIEIAAPYGVIRVPIVGIIVDYSDQQGTIFMDREVFIKHWKDDSVSDFRVFVADGEDVGTVRQRIIERFAGQRQIFVLTNDESRQYILKLTDQWLSLMNVQVAVAVLVAMLGIVNTLTVSITDRRRELGVLRAVGALRWQIRRTIWMEALAIAILGLVLGAALGALNLHYVLHVVQREVAGLRLDYEFPVHTVLALVPLILAAAFVAAVWPAEAAVRASLVEALEYE
jgi:putative ABC transport system permease protein